MKIFEKYFKKDIGSTSVTHKPLIILSSLTLFLIVSVVSASFIDFGPINLFNSQDQKEIEVASISLLGERESFEDKNAAFNRITKQSSELLSDNLAFEQDNIQPASLVKPVIRNNQGLNNASIVDNLTSMYKDSLSRVKSTDDYIASQEALNAQATEKLQRQSETNDSNANLSAANSYQTKKSKKRNDKVVKKDSYGCTEDEIYIEYLGCSKRQSMTANQNLGQGVGQNLDQIVGQNAGLNNKSINLANYSPPKKEDAQAKKANVTDLYIEKGYVIPVTLNNRITSQYSGIVTAIVNRDIYDSKNKRVLIPKGSVFYGKNAEAQGGYDKDRLLILWNEIRVGEETIKLDNFSTLDSAGEAGVKVEEETQYTKLFVTSALLALVGTSINDDSEDPFSKGLNKQLANTSNKIINKTLDQRPKFTVESGTMMNIVVKENIYF